MASYPVKVLIWEGYPPWNPPMLPYPPGRNPWDYQIHHQGVLVFNDFYEYGRDGIKKTSTNGDWESHYCEGPWPKIFEGEMGQTRTTQQEFDKWIDLMKMEKFTSKNSDKNPSVYFAIDACNFLGVWYPQEWDKISRWYDIEVVAWDLSGGLTDNPIVDMAFDLVSGFNSPDGIYHAGIIFCGYLYEYSTAGIMKVRATVSGNTTSCCSVGAMKYRKKMGITCSTGLAAFDEWITEVKTAKYSGSKYCSSKNQCVHFALDACKKLGLSGHPDWKVLCKLTVGRPNLVKFGESLNDKSEQRLVSESVVNVIVDNNGITFRPNCRVYRQGT